MKKSKGFLLVEVGLTVVILSVGILLVVQAFRSSVRAEHRVEDLSRAILLAQEKWADLELQMALKKPLEESEGNWPGTPFGWSVKPEVPEGSQMVRVTLTLFKETPSGPQNELVLYPEWFFPDEEVTG